LSLPHIPEFAGNPRLLECKLQFAPQLSYVNGIGAGGWRRFTRENTRRMKVKKFISRKMSVSFHLWILFMALWGLLGGLPAPVSAQTFSCDNVTEIPRAECNALVAFYHSTNGGHWDSNEGWLRTTTPCQWKGVTCQAGHIKKLRLYNNQLTGTLPPEIGNLKQLSQLTLDINQLRGNLPPELGNLTNLESLSLQKNLLSGELPSELEKLKNLRTLLVHKNQLSGSIPIELINLNNLSLFTFYGNPDLCESADETMQEWLNRVASSYHYTYNICETVNPETVCNNITEIPAIECQALIAFYRSTGEVLIKERGWFLNIRPCSWVGITCENGHITRLDVQKVGLKGTIPPEIGNLSQLQHLTLAQRATGQNPDSLTGNLPPEIGNLTNLKYLAIHGSLRGPLPPEIGNLTRLEELDLFQNFFNGDIPPEIGNLKNLKRLNLGNNRSLSGVIPPEIGNLTKLEQIILDHNQLSGSLPPELWNLTNLARINLSWNQLSGSLPPELWNLTNLVYINLHANQLSGSLSPELDKLKNLVQLDLSGNQLSGSLPSELGKLFHLIFLDLACNQLSGNIPIELGELSRLERLDLQRNQLIGHIPKEFKNLTNLQELDLSFNQLHGEIPREIIGSLINLRKLAFRDNQLSGVIPREIGNLINLEELDFGGNQLGGAIPPEIGNLSGLKSLHLANNHLTNKLPTEIGNVTNLQSLQLGNNDLRGALPEHLLSLNQIRWFYFQDTSLCEPPEPRYQSWLKRIPDLRSSGVVCSDLILTLEPGANMHDIESFLDQNDVVYHRLFDGARGNAALKQSLGIGRSYYIESSSVAKPEQLRQKFLSLTATEDCHHNQQLTFDQKHFRVPYNPDVSQKFRGTLQKLDAPDMESWKLARGGSPVLTAVIDDFTSLKPPILVPKGQVPQKKKSLSHGIPVAQLVDSDNSDMLFLNVASWDGSYAKFDTIFEAIEYAVDEKLENPAYEGAVINLSLSAPLTHLGKTPDKQEHNVALFQRWIRYASLSGVPIVTSMGNYNWDVPHYPAAFPETIAVGGSNRNLQRWIEQMNSVGSNVGDHLEFLELSNGVEGTKVGTSFSTARVTKTVVALLETLLTTQPEMSADNVEPQLRWLLDITALDGVGDPAEDTPGRDRYYGWGVVDAEAAIACAEHGGVLVRPDTIDFGAIKVGERSALPVKLTNCSPKDSFVVAGARLEEARQPNSSPSAFQLMDFPEGVVLESGKTYRFTVTFRPHAVGNTEALLRFSSSPAASPGDAPQLFEVALRGSALSAGFTGVVSHPRMVDFGDVRVHQHAAVQVTLTNYQQEPVTFEALQVRELDPNAGFQVLDFPAAQVLELGESLSFEVRFRPETAGLKHAFLSIRDAEHPDEPYEIPVYGRAIEPSRPPVGSASSFPGFSDLDLFQVDPTQLTLQADNLMQRGVDLYNQSAYWPAHEKFHQALKLYELARDDRGAAEAFSTLGMTYSSVGRFEQSLEALLQAKAMYHDRYLQHQDIRDRLQEGIILNKIGMTSTRLGYHLKALRTFDEVLQIERELGRREDEGRTLMNIGVVYLNQGWLSQANGYFTEGLAVSEEVSDVEGQAKTLANIGTVCYRKIDYSGALTHYSSALQLFRRLKQAETEEGSLLLQIGDVYQAQTRYPDAFRSYQEALRLFTAIQDERGEITALKNLGNLARQQGRYAEALSFYHDALDKCYHSHDTQEAITVLEQMLEVYRRQDNARLEAATLTQIGEAYNQLRRYDEAIQKLVQAMLIQGAITDAWGFSTLTVNSTLDDERGLSFTFLVAGEVFLRQEAYDKAIQLLNLASEAQGAENGWLDGKRLHTDLAEAYLRQGRYAEAAQELEKLPQSAYVRMLRGELFAARGERENALPSLNQACEMFGSAEQYENTGRVLVDLAELQVQQGAYSEARTAFQKALLNYRMAGELKGEAIALTRLGDVQPEQDSLDYYRQALELYRTLDDREGQLDVLHRMAAIQGGQSHDAAAIELDLAKAYINQGDYDDAIATLGQIDSSQCDLALQADIFLQLGVIYRLTQEYQNAQNVLQQGFMLYSDNSVSTTKAELVLNLGEVFFRQVLESDSPDFSEALEYYQQAYNLYAQLGDLQGQGQAGMRIGDVYLKQGNYEAAIERYNEAVTLLSQVDDHYNQVLALMSLGEACDSLGLYWDALEAYRRALGMMHDTGNFLFLENFHVRKDVRLALQVLNTPPLQATRQVEAVKPADVYRQIAEVYDNLGDEDAAQEALNQAAHADMVDGNEDDALATYEDLREVQESNADLEGEAETLEEMAAIEANNGETEEAVEHLEDALDLRRRMYDYDGQERIVEQIESLDAGDNALREPQSPEPTPTPISPDTHLVAAELHSPTPAQADHVGTRRGTAPPTWTLPPFLPTAPSSSEISPRDVPDSAASAAVPTADNAARLRRKKAEALNNRGLVYIRQGQYLKAERVFLNAQHLQATIGDMAGQAETLNNRGLLYYTVRQYTKAAALLNNALTLMRTSGDQQGEATVLNQLGLVLVRQGERQQSVRRLETALGTFRQALTLSRRSADQATSGTIMNNLGLVYARLMLVYRSLGETRGDQGHLREAFAYQRIAFTMFQRALHAYQESLMIVRAAHAHGAESATLHNIGELYALLALDQRALTYLWPALRLERRSQNRLDEARTLGELGYLYERQGRRRLREAHETFKEKRSVSGAILLANSVWTLGQALSLYEQSLAIQERLRAGAQLDEFKTRFAEEAIDVYQQAVLLLATMHQPAAAFDLTERARARTLLDLLGQAPLSIRSGVAPDLLRQEDTLRSRLTRLYHTLQEAFQAPLSVDNASQIHRLHALIASAEHKQDALWHIIKVQSPEYASLRSVDPLTCPQLQTLLDDATTLVSYFVTPKTTLIFVLTRHEVKMATVAVREAELQTVIKTTSQKGEPLDVRLHAFEQLYAWLIEPILPFLQTERVGIIPHNVLHYLPFAALKQHGASYFGETHRLFVLPSASVWQFVLDKHRKPHEGAGSVLVVAYGAGAAEELPYLKHAEHEADAIARLYQTTASLGAAAQEGVVKAQSETARLVHIASHAVLDAAQPLHSYLVLAADAENDGRLEVSEIYQLSLAQARLVTLSACQTALGPVSRGDEIVALNRAFLYAGAPTVLASLWSVNDKATSHLMTALYDHLHHGLDVAAALQLAQQETRRDYPDPREWAAFVVTGYPGEHVTMNNEVMKNLFGGGRGEVSPPFFSQRRIPERQRITLTHTEWMR